MGEVGGRGWKFFDTRPCAKDEYFRAHQEKDIGSHLYIDPRRFYEVFLVSDFKAKRPRPTLHVDAHETGSTD